MQQSRLSAAVEQSSIGRGILSGRKAGTFLPLSRRQRPIANQGCGRKTSVALSPFSRACQCGPGKERTSERTGPQSTCSAPLGLVSFGPGRLRAREKPAAPGSAAGPRPRRGAGRRFRTGQRAAGRGSSRFQLSQPECTWGPWERWASKRFIEENTLPQFQASSRAPAHHQYSGLPLIWTPPGNLPPQQPLRALPSCSYGSGRSAPG